MSAPLTGLEAMEVPGFSYLPGFITEAEGAALLQYFGSLKPLWESRYVGEEAKREGQGSRRLTRPVYWLGAWQFACLGYYSLPNHQHEKCLRAEPIPEVMQSILRRLAPKLAGHQDASEQGQAPNTCLINYYGTELTRDRTGRMQPVDYARLRMHRDGEPGPVVMFSIGRPALFEFVDGATPKDPELALWLQDRSVVLFSGPHFKDHLYHRVTRVLHGDTPAMPRVLEGFKLMRVSVSFRSVPEAHIKALREFSAPAQAQVRGYVEQLAESSAHFRAELEPR
ncbi:MAG: alpha-ketoglutarate-dependent dioxygenase AlkB [Archangium sp.]|nr:alpha-ketoglutarate-dependent dioxygenase AlkB [Archangium sp.]